jgi:hypothetical protein
MWCVAELKEEYIARREEVLAVYERPWSADEPVVCVDEKSVTLHADVREGLPMQPDGWPDGTMSTSAVAPPTCFAGWKGKLGCTLPR